MFCLICGQSVSDDEKFCHACGAPIRRPSAPAETAPTQGTVGAAPIQGSENAAPVQNPAGAAPAQVSEGTAPVIVSENNVDSTDNIASPAELENDVTEILDSSGGNTGYYPPEAAAFSQAGFNPPVNAPSAELAQAATAAKPKKKRRILPWIIAGASAAVVGAGALIWFLNTSAVLHTFMGDQNYAASVLDNYVDNVSKKASGITSLMFGDNSDISNSDSYNELAINSAKKFFDVFKTQELGLTLKASVEPGNTLKKEFSSSPDNAEAIEELSGISLKLDLASSEDALDTMATLSCDGGSINAAVRVEPEAVLVMAPSVNDTVLRSEKSSKETLPESISNADEQGNNLSKLYETFIKYYKKAEFNYESGNVQIGEDDIGCTVITAVLEDDNLTDMLSDIGDIISDISGGSRNPFADFDADESDAKLTVESYVTAQNRALGLTITFTGKNSYTGNKTTASITVKNNDKAFFADIKQGKIKVAELEIINPSAEEDGTISLKFNPGSNSDETITISGKIKDAGTTEAFGQKLPTGKYSFTVKGNSIDRYLGGLYIRLSENNSISAADFIKNSTVALELAAADNGYNIALGFKNKDLGNFSVSLDIQPKISAAMPDFSASQKVLNADDDSEEAVSAVQDYTIEVLSAVDTLLSDKSIDAFGRVALNSETLHKSVEEMKSRRRRVEVYSGYTENTISEANEYAEKIYSKTNFSKFFSRELQTIKLYFDKNGTLKVLDPANEVESVLKDMYGSLGIKDAYAEIIVHINRNSYSPIGVSVVKTSDSSKIPSAMPGEYDMLDHVYDWQFQNIIDDYAVGTYPSLLTKEHYEDIYGNDKETAKEQDEKRVETINQLNGYAKNMNDAFLSYLSETHNRITSTSTGGMYFEVDNNGKWSSYPLTTYFANNVSGSSNNILDYFKNKMPEIKNCVFTLMLYKGQFVGVAVRDRNGESGYISSLEFKNGFSDWSYIDGLSGNTCYGTYPVLRKMTKSDYATVLKEFNGTWKNGSDKLVITNSTFDVNNILGEMDITYSYFAFLYGEANHFYLYYMDSNRDFIERAEYINGEYNGYKRFTNAN